MPRVTYVHPSGCERTVDVAAGTSVMLAAVTNSIEGIVAECGGSCVCATCHVYVDEHFLPMLSPIGPSEEETLDSVMSERRANSRLSCQLVLGDALDGLVVRLPERQI